MKVAPKKKDQKPNLKIAAADTAKLARMVRVNQAGEYGAKRIYAGQIAALKRKGLGAEKLALWEKMKAQEETHLAAFDTLIAENQIRPTLLQPVWHVAGFGLGVVTALMGEKAAHACTVAVEEVIDEHYAAQSAQLEDYPELQALIEKFRAEEIEHKESAFAQGAEQAPAYPLLRRLIRAGSKTAIWLSERV